MKINKYYYLGDGLYPYQNWKICSGKATQKQFDKVAIYHKTADCDFRPIVFTEFIIKSARRWEASEFYKGLKLCLKTLKTGKDNYYQYTISGHTLLTDTVFWGCRMFHKKDLLALKKLMEEEYTKGQLC